MNDATYDRMVLTAPLELRDLIARSFEVKLAMSLLRLMWADAELRVEASGRQSVVGTLERTLLYPSAFSRANIDQLKAMASPKPKLTVHSGGKI